jgi:hypothetical protein
MDFLLEKRRDRSSTWAVVTDTRLHRNGLFYMPASMMVTNKLPRSKLRGIKRKKHCLGAKQASGNRTLQGNKLPRSKLRGIKRKNTAWVRSKLRGIAPCKGLKRSIAYIQEPNQLKLARPDKGLTDG